MSKVKEGKVSKPQPNSFNSTDIKKSSNVVEIRLEAFYPPYGGFTYWTISMDTSNRWSATKKRIDFQSMNDSSKFNITTLIAKCSFDSLIQKLVQSEIFMLPSQYKLKKKLTIRHGAWYTIKYKVQNKFREYYFENPSSYSKIYPDTSEFKKYSEIVRLFWDELAEVPIKID